MPTQLLMKFSSQATPEILEALKVVAHAEGRKLHAVLDEAFRDYLQKKSKVEPRREVMQALASSMQEFDALYQALAK